MLLPPCIIPPELSPLLHQTAFLGLSCNPLSSLLAVQSTPTTPLPGIAALIRSKSSFPSTPRQVFSYFPFSKEQRSLNYQSQRGQLSFSLRQCSSCSQGQTYRKCCSELSVSDLQWAKGHVALRFMAQVLGSKRRLGRTGTYMPLSH